ncbi:hypothetical protein SAMN05216526_1035 [Ectothiorhodosinus mongolicus]|uniref:Sel1 repeat-containing protein n=1 Tax=Ectothiorhodosinus mongolicus TaxID=233100 RepID=A0A1R3VWC0_9GAMM|nr:SEL1-like repeat protein [Ectothiorhodosinus mongolicus]ULX56970.1 sel1 repeat family protein [Ectothiorhodosinus mongolicus]SIT69233.1 hypothetical protein SAMN05216526_1035 [Ectothiorhodosinus mongolicus]
MKIFFLLLVICVSPVAVAETPNEDQPIQSTPRAMLAMGWMFLQGDRVEHDRAQAEYWFRESAETGYAPAQIALASLLYADAQGGLNPEGVFEARDLLLEAAPAQPPIAAYFLARIYSEGIGIEVDPSLAAQWANIAAAGQDPAAIMLWQRLEAQLVPEERDAARQRAVDWLQGLEE